MALTVSEIEEAIQQVLTKGQSTSFDGVLYTRASLPALMSLRDQAKADADRATRPTLRAFNLRGIGY